MQPTIICTAPVPGMIFLNGRFAGEAAGERPLFAPVAPSGALYLEYRPLSGGGGGMARRMVFAGGAPLAESLEEAEGLACISWPGGALEVEFTAPKASVERFLLDGLPCSLRRGEAATLTLNGVDVDLPRGAALPELLRLPGAAALMGAIEGGGQYLAALTPDLSAQTGLLIADGIEPSDGGLFNAVVSLGDTVGHGRLEQWLTDGSGLTLVSSENTWAQGAPHWPDTAEATMIAAVEAALAGLPAEAEGYLSPALAAGKPLSAIGEACQLCVPMRYGPPDARPCVGLLKAVNAHLATVRPLYYRAAPSGGRQGPWQIEGLWME